MKIYCIYRITNLINNKTYIGFHHLRKGSLEKDGYLGSGLLIKQAVLKYGYENFKREILEEFTDKEEASKAEIKYIERERLIGHAEYNIHDGGCGGNTSKYIHDKSFYSSEEYRLSKSRAFKGRKWWHKDNIDKFSFTCPGDGWLPGRTSNYNNGKKLSEETKKKISEKAKKSQANRSEEQRLNAYKKTKETWLRNGWNPSMATKGKHWYNNGVKQVLRFECPEGFVPGKLEETIRKSANSKRKNGK